jgi:cell division protein ZapE
MVSEHGVVVSLSVVAEAGGQLVHLVDRNPVVPADDLLAALVPPPRFASVSFESYEPDPGEPTQAAAVAALRAFAAAVDSPAPDRRWWNRAPAPPERRVGIYLDGGFGVGKTHLLASLWRVVEGPKLFATFVEITHLVGALGFHEAVARLKRYRLVCIDEFELDDPGDTVLMSTLLAELADARVRLAATSNTLPDRLGEDRFAAADFLREIHGLAAHFDVVRIDGPDYRHRGLPPTRGSLSAGELAAVVAAGAAGGRRVASDDFASLLGHLAEVHPSRYGALVGDIDLTAWHEVHPIEDQAMALRFVVLVDRLYDRDVAVAASGVTLDEVFAPEMLTGGYRKKYYRAISRLTAMTHPPASRSPDSGGR